MIKITIIISLMIFLLYIFFSGKVFGADTGFKTAGTVEVATQWLNLTTVRLGSSDNSYATCDSGCNADVGKISDFNFGVPTGATIDGIEVAIEAKEGAASGSISLDVSLSWDNDTTYTTAKTAVVDGTTDTTYTLGGPTDTWGRSWTDSELADGAFILFLNKVGSSDTISIDMVQVKVYYTASAGEATTTPVTTISGGTVISGGAVIR